MTLNDLGLKYGTDKSTIKHNYLPFYEQTLPKAPKKLLEIGVLSGASIRMWKEWFPETEIHGLDLFSEGEPPAIEGVVWHKGNQCDWLLLEQLRKENFDVIIDDASHNSRDQMMTFYGLFNGKHYYIEDTHCCSESFYQDGLPEQAAADELFRCLNDSPSSLYINSYRNILLIKDQNQK